MYSNPPPQPLTRGAFYSPLCLHSLAIPLFKPITPNPCSPTSLKSSSKAGPLR